MQQNLQNYAGRACCSRKSYYAMLKRMYPGAKKDENAEECKARAELHQADKELKVKGFNMKLFVSYCVLAKQMHNDKKASFLVDEFIHYSIHSGSTIRTSP